MKKELKICLAWHNLNSTNYGVGALAISQINLLMEAAKENGQKVSIHTLGTVNINSLNIKEQVEERFATRIPHIDFSIRKLIKDLFKFDFSLFRVFRNYDVILDIGEGDSFADIYGLKRFFILSFTKLMPIFYGKKLVLSPQTIGPFNNVIARTLARWIIKKSDAVFSRDHKSTQFLKEMGLDCVEVSDVAFTLPYDKKNKLSNTVGINISGLLWNGGYSGKNQFGLMVDYPSFVKKMVTEFRARGKQVHLVGHVIADNMPVEDDYRVCLSIKDMFKDDDDVIVAPKFKSPIEAKNYISQLKFFTGSRMHATIGALSSGVVTVPIAYSRKFSGVFGSLNYHYTLNAYELDNDGLINDLFAFYDNQFSPMEQAMQNARSTALQRNQRYVCYLKEMLANA